jgi:hypothetical protein
MPIDPAFVAGLVDDDGSNTVDTLWNKAKVAALVTAIDAAIAAGAVLPWTAVAYSALNFNGNGAMTWTVDAGDIFVCRYGVLGKLLIVNIDILTSSVGGTLNYALQFKIPGGYVAAANAVAGYCRVIDNAAAQVAGEFSVTTGSNFLQIFKPGVAIWSAATNTTRISGTAIFEVQ